jgi:mono/diheme cytochrome c family protein
VAVKPKKAQPDHAYNIPRLNKIFFWSSLAALLSIVWWVVDVDYDKPWKRYQREFRSLSAEKVQTMLEREQNRLGRGRRKQQLDELQAQLTTAQDGLRRKRVEQEEARARLGDAEKRYYVADQANRFARAVYDAYRYEFETLREHVEAGEADHSQLEPAEERLHELDLERQSTLSEFQEADTERARVQSELAALTAAVDEAESGMATLEAEKTRLENQLENLKGGLVTTVRNSPMLDFISPNIKIQQVVVDDLRFDVNFQTIPRVDRCHTCHQGIAQEGWEDAEQPFRSHPNLDLFLTSRSPHPIEQFGCSVCHSGWDRSVDFTLAAHYPRNAEQAEEWRQKYDWHTLHRWDHPMLPRQYSESACYKCHKDEVYLAGAPTLNMGREVFERNGCWGCHKVEGQIGPKVGPSLRSLAAKSDRDWVRRWVEDPWSFRPTTAMPRIFNLSNTSDEQSLARNDVEVAAITEYLFEKSEARRVGRIPFGLRGDALNGEQLVNTVGCKACHLVGTPQGDIDAVGTRQRFGPNLIGLSEKTTADWVYAWIQDPKHWNPETRMPDLRLSNQEAADITAYLMELPAAEGFGSESLPPVDPQLRDEVTLEYLQNQMSKRVAAETIATMSDDDKMLFLGEQLIGRYGCYACHDIPGFETAEPIGVELTTEGSKIITRFDFGLVHEVPHTRWDWIETKLHEPRIWDRGKVKSPQEKLRMPKFNLSDEQITAVTTFVLGLVKDEIPATKRKMYDAHEQARNEGMHLVANSNCIGCHQLMDFGGDFAQLVDDPSKAPPLLTPTGAKVQPEWLIAFLHAPTTIRPWLDVRMPSFHFERERITELVSMFQGIARVDERYPFLDTASITPESLRRGRALFGQRGTSNYAASLKCNSCHPSGDVLPESPPTQWGPDLNMARERLRPEWVPHWLRNPQAVQPGTRMPNFFYDEDTPLVENPEQDIFDLRNFLWSLGDAGQVSWR